MNSITIPVILLVTSLVGWVVWVERRLSRIESSLEWIKNYLSRRESLGGHHRDNDDPP
jgi:hypothetical protein